MKKLFAINGKGERVEIGSGTTGDPTTPVIVQAGLFDGPKREREREPESDFYEASEGKFGFKFSGMSRDWEWRVFIPRTIYEEMLFLARKSDPNEIQMLAEVVREGSDIRISKLHLLRQRVTAGFAEFDPLDVALLVGSHDHPENLRGWVHSHVRMGNFWSGTDEATIRDLCGAGWLLSVVMCVNGKLLARMDVSLEEFVSKDESLTGLLPKIATWDNIKIYVEDVLNATRKVELTDLFNEKVLSRGRTTEKELDAFRSKEGRRQKMEREKDGQDADVVEVTEGDGDADEQAALHPDDSPRAGNEAIFAEIQVAREAWGATEAPRVIVTDKPHDFGHAADQPRCFFCANCYTLPNDHLACLWGMDIPGEAVSCGTHFLPKGRVAISEVLDIATKKPEPAE